ncbi:AMP-binding protein, partial [Streptomyces sp. SID8361]|nr:AMP-binding protein [Streptomyces sp. SID8361]
AVETDPEKPAVVIYTSGTSGRPKGVMQPYRLRSFNLQVALQSPEPIVCLSTLPVSNSSGSAVDVALASGGTVVLHDG